MFWSPEPITSLRKISVHVCCLLFLNYTLPHFCWQYFFSCHGENLPACGSPKGFYRTKVGTDFVLKALELSGGIWHIFCEKAPVPKWMPLKPRFIYLSKWEMPLLGARQERHYFFLLHSRLSKKARSAISKLPKDATLFTGTFLYWILSYLPLHYNYKLYFFIHTKALSRVTVP